ncbi:nucleoside diphosphate kinase regulator [Bradyrhizobium vignae]|uniref:nucleoside diphosphate kinase regulator n=1 Tax=Bradyrhizobium vignae TaxID=1549949 RepID=UPI003221E6AD
MADPRSAQKLGPLHFLEQALLELARRGDPDEQTKTSCRAETRTQKVEKNTMSITSTKTTVRSEIKPPITLTANDYKRLSLLARAAENKMPDVASVLTEELERAHVLADGHPVQTVCMGSEVRFRDDSTGTVRTATLVYPDDADISRRKLSVLTPVGAALIGLNAGNSITWETRTGDLRRLTVLEVRVPQSA